MGRTVRIARVAAIAAACLLSQGCAVYMAANQPEKKDLGVLKAGSPRSAVIAEIGTPVQSLVKDGAKVDLYTFTQGYSGLEKGGRAVLHGAADVFTLGLWEVIGTPIEGAANGTKVAVEVTYDKDDRVAKVVPIRGQEKIAEGTESKG
jgi:hypothetical protein